MAYPQNLATWCRPVQRDYAAVAHNGLLLLALSLGCSAHVTGTTEPGQFAHEAQPRALLGDPKSPINDGEVVRLRGRAPEGEDPTTTSPPHDLAESNPPKRTITLPMAIEMCVNNNFRVLAGAERMSVAEGDLITSSLIPNPSLFADCQLIPLQRADIKNQLGPPQWDTLVSFPIDWLLFGKRVAAMQAARLGVEISGADFADVLRVQVAQTVDAFYEVLADEEYLKLAERNLAELTDLEKLTEELAKNKKVGQMEVDRSKLAVHEALLERHDRELALDIAKARLRPFLGRTAADADYEIEGVLTVTAVVPSPKLADALALAEAHRPDLLSGRKALDQANAVVELERRKAKPQVAVQPGWSYQDQAHQSLFRNGSMFDIGISTSLPLTDRNQGNIRRAQAQVQERRFTFQGNRADALADVEASLASYDDAVEHLTQFNTRETLEAAHELRKNMEAAYRAGDRKLIELLDAHKAYRDRLAHVIEFESDYWRTLNKLHAAVGLNAYDPEKGATEPIGKQADKGK
jgi:outer membrane protein, heavy metal efflux system